jgi:hypothetical protein
MMRFDVGASDAAFSVCSRHIRKTGSNGRSEGWQVIAGNKCTSFGWQRLRIGGNVTGNDAAPAGHRFERNERHALVTRRADNDVSSGQPRSHIAGSTDEMHPRRGTLRKIGSSGSVADKHKLRFWKG